VNDEPSGKNWELRETIEILLSLILPFSSPGNSIDDGCVLLEISDEAAGRLKRRIFA
jgi:hypothetical protein